MKSSKLSRREAKLLFRTCLVNGVLDEGRIRAVLKEVSARKPRGFMAILGYFQRLVQLEVERRTARVESAVPLDGTQRQSLQAGLAAKYGTGLNVIFSENPSLLGGLRVRVGSDVFDGSIKAKLNALEQSLA